MFFQLEALAIEDIVLVKLGFAVLPVAYERFLRFIVVEYTLTMAIVVQELAIVEVAVFEKVAALATLFSVGELALIHVPSLNNPAVSVKLIHMPLSLDDLRVFIGGIH